MNSAPVPEIIDNGNEYGEALGPFNLTLDILEVIVSAVAILVNTLTIYILAVRLKLKQSDTILSFVLSVFDIIFSTFIIINCLVVWITNHSAILLTLYSQVVGYLFFCLGACVVDSVTLLSLIRFLAIYKHVQYSNKFWVSLILGLVSFNFMFGLIPLVQNQFKAQPSLKYSSVEFNFQNSWLINFHYCFIWTKLAINIIIITVCYVFISIFYYNYLKNYREEEVEENEMLPNFNCSRDNICQRGERKRASGVSESIIDNSSMLVRQSNLRIDCAIDNLMISTLSKLYVMLIVYTLELLPLFLIQTIFKLLNIPISPVLDSVVSFLTQLIPLTNPCFVLFFHFETYQELRFFIYMNYHKFFN